MNPALPLLARAALFSALAAAVACNAIGKIDEPIPDLGGSSGASGTSGTSGSGTSSSGAGAKPGFPGTWRTNPSAPGTQDRFECGPELGKSYTFVLELVDPTAAGNVTYRSTTQDASKCAVTLSGATGATSLSLDPAGQTCSLSGNDVTYESFVFTLDPTQLHATLTVRGDATCKYLGDFTLDKVAD